MAVRPGESGRSGTTVPSGGRRLPERRLILIRHGQTEFNLVGRMQGQLDTPLTEAGRAEAQAAAAELGTWPIGTVVSSDLQRARDTAALLAEAVGVEFTTDPRLRETDLGDWSGKAHEDVDAVFPGQRSHWRLDPTWAPPNGETRVEVSDRSAELVDELMAGDAWDAGAVMLVAHGGTIAALTSRLLGIPTEHYPMFGSLGNTRWSQLVARPAGGDSGAGQWRTPRWFLEGWNVGVTAPAPVTVANADEGEATGR
ncbi:histidine phosphatase family protein [Corynebacterium sp.]|uniref:histidine phosphatase family protein n=1 Tax=Corynebacterium sp. TaxID=1720 RepID=UPI0025BCF5B5|nr:histidine phosphatase family protein [Corynebacterium sp.]